MDQNSFISDADTALANLIWNAIKNEAKTKNVISSQEQISFSSPKTPQTTRKLSIFLYKITQTSERNMPPTADASQKNPLHSSSALNYLVTPFTGHSKDDHALIENIIHAVSSTAIIVGAGSEFLVKIDSLSLDALSKLWIALDAPFRFSVSLIVCPMEQQLDSTKQGAIATVMSQTPAVGVEPVAQLYRAVLKTFTEQYDGWKKRNMFVKQWIFQDFTKITDMTVEEMFAALNSLGDKLEFNASKAQFIKPLNLLAAYYQHQLNELKGIQKLSHKQTENIEAIDCWIKEVKALVEALGS